jgi:hypothetical protein
VKKIISIGVALALLAMVVVPVAVTADGPAYNSTVDKTAAATYAKIPFGILGTGIQLIGDVVANLGNITASLPFNVTAVTNLVGSWTMGPFSWLSDLTGWTMVTLGDVISGIQGLANTMGFGNYTGPLAQMLYILGARMFDASGTLPTSSLNTTYYAGFGVNASLIH